MATAVASTRIIYKSIKNLHENCNGRGHKNGGGNQCCTGGLRTNKTCFLQMAKEFSKKKRSGQQHTTQMRKY